MFNTGGLIVILPYAISESTDTLPGVFSNIHKHCVYHRWLHINHETITFFSGNKLVCSTWYAGYRPLSVTLGALFPHLFFLIYWCTVLVHVRGKKKLVCKWATCSEHTSVLSWPGMLAFWIQHKELSGRMDIVSSWVNDCAPFTSLVLEMPNMVCFVRTNSLINLVHIRKFGSCSIASLI